MIAPGFSLSHWLIPFGSVEILLPLSLLATLWIVATSGSTLLLRAWIVPMIVASIVIGATKIAFLGWGLGIASIDFTGVSGHAFYAAAVYPVLARLALPRLMPQVAAGMSNRQIAIFMAYVFAAIMAFSRIRLGVHSWSEIISGSALGVTVSAYALVRIRATSWRRPPLKAVMAAVLGAFIALPLLAPLHNTHDLVSDIALKMAGQDDPFDRWDLQLGVDTPRPKEWLRDPTPNLERRPQM